MLAKASPVARLLGTTRGGRAVIDLSYEELAPDLCGYGVQRGVLFHALLEATREAGIPLHTGVEVTSFRPTGTERLLVEEGGAEHGPFELVVIAAGARSRLRAQLGFSLFRDRTYPRGPLWFMGNDPGDASGALLRQGFDGCRVMAGLPPSGRPVEGAPLQVSLFWSLRGDALERWRERGLDAWKRDVLRVLPQAAPVLEQIHTLEQLTFAAYQDKEMTDWHVAGAMVLGDAAHATSLQLGRGVDLALTHASMLASSLRGHDLEGALWHYSEDRREHLRFYSWATRFLTPFSYSNVVPLGWLRDALMGPLCRVRPLRRQMLLSRAGVHRGLLARALPLS